MRTRKFLIVTVLAMMFGGTSAVAWAEEHDDTTPEANTSFEAVATIEAETAFIKYHVCNLNAETDGCGDTEEIEVFFSEEGTVNHGSFVSAFAKGFEGPGKGCILRYIAQSDWGQEGSEHPDLNVAETFCSFNAERGGDDLEGADNGKKPPWAGNGKPDFAATKKAGGPPAWAGAKGGPNVGTDSDS